MNCVVCGKELFGRQTKMCSVACRSKYWSNKLSGKRSFWKGKHHSEKHKQSMRERIGDKSGGWRGGKFNNAENRSVYAVNLRREKIGFTKEIFNQRLKEQDNKCAICNCVFDENIAMKKKSADHCHNKNIARGILCRKCNLLLGNCEDNISILSNAISYLNFWQRTA